MYLLEDLRPHQRVGIRISARTIAGEGPLSEEMFALTEASSASLNTPILSVGMVILTAAAVLIAITLVIIILWRMKRPKAQPERYCLTPINNQLLLILRIFCSNGGERPLSEAIDNRMYDPHQFNAESDPAACYEVPVPLQQLNHHSHTEGLQERATRAEDTTDSGEENNKEILTLHNTIYEQTLSTSQAAPGSSEV